MSYFDKSISGVVALAIVLTSNTSVGNGFPSSVTNQDSNLVFREKVAVKCAYPNVIRSEIRQVLGDGRITIISDHSTDNIRDLFGVSETSMNDCLNAQQAFNVAKSGMNLSELNLAKYPLYFQVLRNIMPRVQNGAGSDLKFLSRAPRQSTQSSRVDYFALENLIRADLPLQQNIVAEDCVMTDEELRRELDASFLYNISHWKHQLHSKGYNCMANRFYRVSQLRNVQKGLDLAQLKFEENLSDRKLRDLRLKESIQLDSKYFITYFPNLGYDLPSDSPRELMTVEAKTWGDKIWRPGLEERFETGFNQSATDGRVSRVSPLGVRFELIPRATIENVRDRKSGESSSGQGQVPYSAMKFKEAVRRQLQTNPNSKAIVIGRSMGGFIAREVLMILKDEKVFSRGERAWNPNLPNKTYKEVVEVALLIGATPFGSVIADFKARSDVHDETLMMLTVEDAGKALATAGLGIFHGLDFGNGLLVDNLMHSAIRNHNVGSMSHARYQSADIARDVTSDYKVLNVIMLKPTLQKYFEGAINSKDVDPVFLHMAMYGPTEGSAPLSHASWDTENSARVFYKKQNHLGYWNMTAEQGFNMLLGTIQTAKDLGMIAP